MAEEQLKKVQEEINNLRQRMEKLERMRIEEFKALSVQGEGGKEGKLGVNELEEWQKKIPHMIDYDIWSIVLAKKQGTEKGTDELMSLGITGIGGDYTHITDISPEDAANLTGALSHAARIVILRECQNDSKYSSDLEKVVSAKYGSLYHHINSLIGVGLLTQEKQRGKYVTTTAGKAALTFLNVLASVIASLEPSERPKDMK